MAIRKKTTKTAKTVTKNITAPKEEKKSDVCSACVTTVEQIFMRGRRLTVLVGISSDFGKEKVGLSLSENVREDADPMELADEIYDLLEVKMDEKFALLRGKDTPEDSEYEADDETEEETEEDEEFDEEEEVEETKEESDEEEEISEEDILAMKKPELLDLIKEEELDIDLKKCKKIADLRDAVIDALFEEEEETEESDEEDSDGEEEEENEDGEDSEDWEDDSWDDSDDDDE